MKKIKVQGDWNVLKGKLKQRFANLTDDDLLFIKGKEEELIGRIQQKIGKTKQEISELIAKL
jgi:uncharacterized protein YjbJ (UPF0337 family)